MGIDVGEKLICKSLEFDGVNDFALGSNTNNEYDFIDYNLPFTISVAFQYKTSGSWLISTYNASTTPQGWALYAQNPTTIRFSFYFDSLTIRNAQAASIPSLIVDNWYFLTYIYDGSGVGSNSKWYINGQYYATLGGTVTFSVITSNNVDIASRGSFANLNMNSVRLWNTNLTDEQALQEYNNGFGRIKPVLPDNCKLDLNMSKSVWNGSQFLIKDQSNNVSDFQTRNMGEDQLINGCYQI